MMALLIENRIFDYQIHIKSWAILSKILLSVRNLLEMKVINVRVRYFLLLAIFVLLPTFSRVMSTKY